MREIKFRALKDDMSNCTFQYGQLVYGDNGEPRITQDGLLFTSCLKGTEGQFTGLKDKNGKEIYEGDVVEFIGGTCDYLYYGIYADERYKIGDKMIVQKLESGYSLAGINMIGCEIPNRVGKVDNYNFWRHQKSLKVIGNIHDNPELLNQI